jgi:hypothetical protein
MRQPGEYIKLMVRDDYDQTLFVPHTEAFLFLEGELFVRPTLKEFVAFIEGVYADFLGEHVVSTHYEGEIRKLTVGHRIWDLEWCGPQEFYYLYTCEPKVVKRDGYAIIEQV